VGYAYGRTFPDENSVFFALNAEEEVTVLTFTVCCEYQRLSLRNSLIYIIVDFLLKMQL